MPLARGVCSGAASALRSFDLRLCSREVRMGLMKEVLEWVYDGDVCNDSGVPLDQFSEVLPGFDEALLLKPVYKVAGAQLEEVATPLKPFSYLAIE